jgi:hypothetical protein
MDRLADHAYWLRERLEEEDYASEKERQLLEADYRAIMKKIVKRAEREE